MSAQHTPGPWHFFPSEDGFPRVYIGGDFPKKRELYGPYVVVNSAEPRADLDVHEANARLIAAAPDLLKALEELRGNIAAASFVRNPHGKRLRAQADAALAKARGEA